jgi:hypothetical protein
MSNLPKEAGATKELDYKGIRSGYVVQCEGGYYAGERGGGAAYDNKDQLIRRFKGDSGAGHPRNFVDAVRAGDRKRLNAEVEVGHRSTAWCNLANIAIRACDPNGKSKYSHAAAEALDAGFAPWNALVEMIESHAKRNSIDVESAFSLSPIFEFDGQQEQFVGQDHDRANPFLKRAYRSQFEVPSIA